MSAATARHETGSRRVELSDVVRLHEAELRRRHPLTGDQRRALAAIRACRTPALGGHLERCAHCGTSRPVYHSCRNRHCPKCQSLAKQLWVEQRCAELLPVPYFHVVFTLPHALNAACRRRPRSLFNLLLRCAWQCLDEFARDEAHLGAELGVTAVLHTWSQTLAHHVHLHCLVSAGGLDEREMRWLSPRHGFLFPVRALSLVFRAKFLAALDREVRAGRLEPDILSRADRSRLMRHRWVVYCKEPFAGARHLLAYLGRYTHRIAISNDRILDVDDEHVRFVWRDRAHGDLRRVMELGGVEFLRRYLTHVLPAGFQRIRHYGLHANRRKHDALALCRWLIEAPPAPSPPTETSDETIHRLTGLDPLACPNCGRRSLRPVGALLRRRPARAPPPPP
jgi:hypothetical protein